MPDNWVVVQIGPVLQVPRQARFCNKQGWWYVYRRSRPATIPPSHNVWREHEVDPWSATKHQFRAQADASMYLRARELLMPWCLVRQLSGQEGHIVAYFHTREAGESWRPFKSDVMMQPGWEKGDEDATRL